MEMMKRKLNLALCLSILLAGFSCSDDNVPATPTLIVPDVTIELLDPPSKDQILDTLHVTTNQDNIEYSLLSENPAGALTIDLATGVISVADETLFDFDSNPQISASVLVDAEKVSRTVSVTVTEAKFNRFDMEIAQYFKEVALGFDYIDGGDVTRRWIENMKIFIGGNPSIELEQELDKIMLEVNQLASTEFIMGTVSDTTQSNFYLFFGPGDTFVSRLSSSFSFHSIVNSNSGHSFVFWGQDIFSGYMYLDVTNTDEQEQLHLLREELTQALGFGRHSDRYAESIFQEDFSLKPTEYSKIDRELIKVLYHPKMEIGLDASGTDEVLIEILSEE